MSTRQFTLAFAAIAALAISILTPGSVAAFGRAQAAAPAKIMTSKPGYGWGYGRGWCYWHPYVCHRG